MKNEHSNQHSKVLLIGRFGNDWVKSCERELNKLGAEVAQAYNCWSGNTVLEETPAQLVVIDGAAMCREVSAERPHALLYRSPQLPILIVNAQDLDSQQRHAAEEHGAHLLDGSDVHHILPSIQRLLRGQPHATASTG